MAGSAHISPYAGGSLNEIIAAEDRVIKRYKGTIARGSEKLKRERSWLQTIPSQISSRHSTLFPSVIDFIHKPSQNLTELHIEKLDRDALSKCILNDRLSPEASSDYFNHTLELLLDDVYNVNTDSIGQDEGYRQYHKKRIDLAREYLWRLAYVKPMLNPVSISVNGIQCPSINKFISWIDLHKYEIFGSTRLRSIHGNFHTDNVLIDDEGSPSTSSISLIDPRGEHVGFPHYDVAKVLITLEAYYDEIHYRMYDIEYRQVGNTFVINLEVDRSYDPHYEGMLDVLSCKAREFAEQEEIEYPDFLLTCYVVECIHILSFCFYHAYGPNQNPDRVRAYLAIFARLAKRLFSMWESDNIPDIPEQRLDINNHE